MTWQDEYLAQIDAREDDKARKVEADRQVREASLRYRERISGQQETFEIVAKPQVGRAMVMAYDRILSEYGAEVARIVNKAIQDTIEKHPRGLGFAERRLDAPISNVEVVRVTVPEMNYQFYVQPGLERAW